MSQPIVTWYFSHFSTKPYLLLFNSPEISGTSECLPLDLRATLGLSEEAHVAVYVGNLSRGRGIEDILENYANLGPRNPVVFLGDGSLRELVNEYSVNFSNIHLLGRVPHEDLIPILSQADFGLCLIEPVSLSDVYSLPNKLFEYWAAGLPILGSDLPEIKRVIDRFDIGRTWSNAHTELSELIIQMQDHEPKRVAPIPSEFSSESMKNALLDFYSRLVNVSVTTQS